MPSVLITRHILEVVFICWCHFITDMIVYTHAEFGMNCLNNKWNITHYSECCVGSLLQYIFTHTTKGPNWSPLPRWFDVLLRQTANRTCAEKSSRDAISTSTDTDRQIRPIISYLSPEHNLWRRDSSKKSG